MREFRYQAILETTELEQSPVLYEVRITYQTKQNKINVYPPSGPVGSEITVTGEGFGTNEPIQIDFGKTLSITFATTSQAGTFTAIFTVDNQPQGIISVTAGGLNSKLTADDYFIITAYSYIKGYIRKKDNSAITGVGVILSGNKSATYTTQTTGYYEFTELSAGTYTVTPILAGYAFIPASRTYQPLTSNMDNQDFVGLSGKIVISPTIGTVGTEVEVQGSDFLPTEAVRIAFGNLPVGTWTTNFAGTFTAKFTIPLTPEGTTTVTAIGLNSGLEQVHLVAREYFYVQFELSHFRVAQITTPQTAGMPFTITITAIDNTGGTLTNFSAGVMLEDLSGSILPETTTNFIAGIWQGTVTITKAGTTSITADYAGKIGTSNPFYVQPGTPTKFVVYPQESVNIPAAGSVSITAQLLDAYDNPVGSSGVTCSVAVVVIAGTSGILSAATTTTNQTGQIATITYFVSPHAGDKAKLSINNYQLTIINYSGTITTIPGTLTHFTFDPIGTQTAGVNFPITITAMDKYDNTTPFQGTASLSDSTNSLNPRFTTSFTAGIWQGLGSITVAGIATITAGSGTISGTSNPFLVRGGTLTGFAIATITTQTAGVGFNITIRAKDEWGNTADGFTGIVDLTLTPPNPPLTPPRRGISLNPTTTTNFTAGLWQGTVTVTKVGTTSIKATYLDKLGTGNPFYVEAGTPTKFIVYPQEEVFIPAGGSVSITAQLLDAYDNPVGSSGITCNVEVVVIAGTSGILSTTTTTTNQSGQIATITYFVSPHAGDKAKLSINN